MRIIFSCLDLKITYFMLAQLYTKLIFALTMNYLNSYVFK